MWEKAEHEIDDDHDYDYDDDDDDDDDDNDDNGDEIEDSETFGLDDISLRAEMRVSAPSCKTSVRWIQNCEIWDWYRFHQDWE